MASLDATTTSGTNITPGDPTSYVVCSLKDIPAADIKKIIRALNDELKKRKSVGEWIKDLKKAYDNIDWGDDWKSERTSDAISALAQLGPMEATIIAKIHDMTDNEQKWKTALSFSKVVAEMISNADDYARELVSCCGDWCPETAKTIENLWRDIIKDCRLPSESTQSMIQQKMAGVLGDYEDDLGKLLDFGCAKPSKRQKTSPKTVSTVDLTASP